jgi:ribosomal protein S18 acetylase RimI-like enzyme
VFTLPSTLVDAGITIRRVTPRDREFLRRLFGTTRLDAVLLATWPPDERTAFLDSQFALQDIHYRRFHSTADFLIVKRHDAPIGRLILDRGHTEWRIVDIGFLPEVRGAGLGTALLRAVQDAAAHAGAARVNLHVDAGNRARALYARLGFVVIDQTETHLAMAWSSNRIS